MSRVESCYACVISRCVPFSRVRSRCLSRACSLSRSFSLSRARVLALSRALTLSSLQTETSANDALRPYSHPGAGLDGDTSGRAGEEGGVDLEEPVSLG